MTNVNQNSQQWVDVVGYNGVYKVSNDGQIKSYFSKWAAYGGKILKPTISSRGYLMIYLYKDGNSQNTLVHRIVADAFILKAEGKTQVNHINGVKTDNRVENLEWVTRSENIRHALRTGLIIRKKKNIVLSPAYS